MPNIKTLFRYSVNIALSFEVFIDVNMLLIRMLIIRYLPDIIDILSFIFNLYFS